MTDTSPEFEKFYREKIMSLTSDERIRIGLSMNETARKIVWSSIPEGLSEEERKIKYFLRLYGSDFPEEELNKIIEWIRTTTEKRNLPVNS